MLCLQRVPKPPLSDFVELLWLYDGFAVPHARERLLPTGTVELVVNLREDQPDFRLPVVAGPHSRPSLLDTAHAASVIGAHFRTQLARQGIMGHSMGGHGALTLGLRHPGRYQSVSAFAPIVAPTQVPWGQKALPGYLGDDPAAWREHDATELVARQPRKDVIRIDQGSGDSFLAKQLRPELFLAAAEKAGQPVEYRAHDGYDHGYYFIQSFIAEHLAFHAQRLVF